MSSNTRLLFLALFLVTILAGCGDEARTPSAGALLAPGTTGTGVQSAGKIPTFPDPSDFVDTITNPYLGFVVGTTFHYEGDTADGHETNTVEVTHQKKTILGVDATVVHDRVYLDGELIEDTFDWYAQDRGGNVWYLGEDSKQIENGKVIGTEGSWEGGVNGAVPGIIMLASPTVGTQYQQEFSAGVAEDMAKVQSLKQSVVVPYGSFTNCLKTQEWTPLEPGVKGYKYYAPGVGDVLEVDKGGERSELISIDAPK